MASRTTLLLMAPILLALNLVFVPFHAGDDEDHFALAYTAAHLRIGPVTAPTAGAPPGGYVDEAIPKVIAHNFSFVRLGPRPVTIHTEWTGREVFRPMVGTTYLPLIYAPQAVAIRIGQAANWTVEQTINTARLANGFTALGIIYIALIYLPEGIETFVLILLVLPKSLQLLASNSADPIIFAISVGLASFFCRALATDWRPRSWHYAIASLGVIALGGERPPLTALGLLLGYVVLRKRSRIGLALAAASILLPVVWWSAVVPKFHDGRCPTPGGLLPTMAYFAHQGPMLIIRTLEERGIYYWMSFIGEFGYGDGPHGRLNAALPLWVYATASALIMLGFMSAASGSTRLPTPGRIVVAVTAIIITSGIFFSLGMTCTSVNSNVIGGVQGRYFMVPILFLGVAASGVIRPMAALANVNRLAVPAFFLASFEILISRGLTLYWT